MDRRIEKIAVAIVVLAALVLIWSPACKRESPLPRSPLALVAQDVSDGDYNVYWASPHEVYTAITPTLMLVHQIRVSDAYSETFQVGYEWHELEYADAGTLAQFYYTWPSTPGQRQRRTFWRVDPGTFDAFVKVYGDELACGPLMLCIYEVDATGGRVPADDGWYDAGVTGYHFYLPMVGGE